MSETKQYYIEPFNGNYQEIAALFQGEYGSSASASNASFLEWQYGDNPYGKAIIVATRQAATQELVGVYIVNPLNLVINGKTIKAALSLNTYTRSDFRGLGLFPKMAEICYALAAEKGVNCIIGFPNQASYGGFIKKLSFRDMGEVTYLIRPLNIIQIITNKILKKHAVLNINTQNFLIDTPNYNIIQLTADYNPALEKFLDAYNHTYAIMSHRSVGFFRWRYQDNPIHNYHVLSIKNADEIASIIVLDTYSQSTLNHCNILEFCVLNTALSLENSKKLLSHVLNILQKNNIHLVKVYTTPATAVENLLKKNSFLEKKRFVKTTKLPFIFRSLPQSTDLDRLDFASWYVTSGDTDVT